MDIRSDNNTPPTFNERPTEALPPYQRAAREGFLNALDFLPRDIACVEAKEIIKHLLDKYQISISELAGAHSGSHLSERSVSIPTRLSPIRQLMQADENTDLLKGLNTLVKGFNEEVSEFEKIIDSKNQKEITAKAHGLTRIATQLNKRFFHHYDYRPNFP